MGRCCFTSIYAIKSVSPGPSSLTSAGSSGFAWYSGWWQNCWFCLPTINSVIEYGSCLSAIVTHTVLTGNHPSAPPLCVCCRVCDEEICYVPGILHMIFLSCYLKAVKPQYNRPLANKRKCQKWHDKLQLTNGPLEITKGKSVLVKKLLFPASFGFWQAYIKSFKRIT